MKSSYFSYCNRQYRLTCSIRSYCSNSKSWFVKLLAAWSDSSTCSTCWWIGCIAMSHIWHEVKAALAKQLPNHSFRMWIEPLSLELADNYKARLTCPNHFFRKRIIENFSDAICTELQRLTGKSMQLDIEVAPLNPPPRESLAVPQQLPLPVLPGHLMPCSWVIIQVTRASSTDLWMKWG